MDAAEILAVEGVPDDRTPIVLDVRELPPPEPLRRTMDRIVDLGSDEVLIQLNDRVPQHLLPRLEERGITYRTLETDGGAMTALWTAD